MAFEQKKTATVVVVGAGISGLCAAYELKRKGVDVIVLEAADYVGGRIKQLIGFVEWKNIELGAEFVHGSQTILKKMIDEHRWPCRLLFTWAQGDGQHPKKLHGREMSMYYFGKEKKLLRYDTDEPDVKKVNELVWSLSEEAIQGNDPRSLEHWLREKGVSERGIKLADAGYSNSLCCTSDKMGLAEVVRLERQWDKYGPGDFRLDNGTSIVIKHLAQELDIRLQWQVKSIDYQNPSSVVLTNDSGERIYASRVIVSVSLPILQDGLIQFNPPLPDNKVQAIKKIEVENAIKIAMKFSRRFWPKELNGVICIDSFVPEMWFQQPEGVGVLTPESRQELPTGVVYPPATYVVEGFACGRFANNISNMSKTEIVNGMLQQLDNMFGRKKAYRLRVKPSPRSEEETADLDNPATTFFLDCVVQDWGKEPFIKGGYSELLGFYLMRSYSSHPPIGADKKTRLAIGEPIQERVFFCGEATNPTSYMTMHGSMETGEKVASQILEILSEERPIRSRL